MLLYTGCDKNNEANESDAESYDVWEIGVIAYSVDSLCEKINESKTGDSDAIIKRNKINEIEKLVYPELNTNDFDLLYIEVNQYSIFYYFMPKSNMKNDFTTFSYNKGIIIRISREGNEGNSSFDAVKKQLGLELTDDGYIYDKGRNALTIPYDFTNILIQVPDELNTYETLTKLCTFKEIIP